MGISVNDPVILFNKITELETSINTDLLQRPVIPGTLAQLISWMRQGEQVQGGVTKFPFPWFSDQGQELNPYEELTATAPELVNLEARVNEYGMKPRMIPRGSQIADIYGVLEGFGPQMMQAAARLQELHAATILGDGENLVHVYDGLTVFNANKKVNPNNAALSTFGNIETGVNLDRAGIDNALDYLDAVPGPDGLPLDMPGTNYIVCSNQQQYTRACDLLLGENVAQAVGNAAAAGSNKGQMGRAVPIKCNLLRRWNSNKAWYALKVCQGPWAPLIASVKEPPQMIIEGLDPAEFVRATRNVIKYSWRGFWGFNPGLPHLMKKFVEK